MHLGRLLPLLLGLLVVVSPGQTQPRDRRDDRGRDRDRERGPRIILYQDAEYRGDSLVLYAGESVENLSGQTFPNGAKLNDSISSVRVEGGWKYMFMLTPGFAARR